ncbi:hypothetical protein IC582_018671 [Cucumis melo]
MRFRTPINQNLKKWRQRIQAERAADLMAGGVGKIVATALAFGRGPATTVDVQHHLQILALYPHSNCNHSL